MASKIIALAGILTVVLMLAVVGEQDYQDALASEQHACQMVAEGLWPPHYAKDFNCPEVAATGSGKAY